MGDQISDEELIEIQKITKDFNEKQHIEFNMSMMRQSQSHAPRCLECGYFFMYETMHEYGPSIGGTTFYKCPNCGFETNSRDMRRNN